MQVAGRGPHRTQLLRIAHHAVLSAEVRRRRAPRRLSHTSSSRSEGEVKVGCGFPRPWPRVAPRLCTLVGATVPRRTAEASWSRTVQAELLAMRDWLIAEGCTHVAMESTGVYWKPAYAVLEGAFELVVGNAHHSRNVPGRKTDVKDCEWIADLLRHGLIGRSFVPPEPIRELRDLLRYRRKLVAGARACARGQRPRAPSLPVRHADPPPEGSGPGAGAARQAHRGEARALPDTAHAADDHSWGRLVRGRSPDRGDRYRHERLQEPLHA